MNTPEPPQPTTIHGVTEEQWLACTDPLRMPKLFRGRATQRKFCLLGCAYVLNAPGGFRNEVAREVVTAIRNAALTTERATFLETLAAAVRRVNPDYLGGGYYQLWQHLSRRPELGNEGGPLALFIREFMFSSPGPGSVNSLAVQRLHEIRCAARTKAVQQVRDAEQNAQKRIQLLAAFDVVSPETAAGIIRDYVLELFQVKVGEQLRQGRWYSRGVPSRVTNKLGVLLSAEPAQQVMSQMVAMVREILGNPFRPVQVRSEWRQANFGAALRIAEHIVTTGDYSQSPILADALEDAGCDNEELLNHCRTGEHLPGCWAVDAVLERN